MGSISSGACVTQRPACEPPGHELRVSPGSAREPRAAFWRINGYRARLLIWTHDEWEKLESPPSDAQLHPCGVWCALRLD
jgi:hypothetical protein